MKRLLSLLLLPTALACSNDRGNGTPLPTPKDAGTTVDSGTVQDSGVTGALDYAAIGSQFASARCAYLSRCVPEYYDANQTDETTCATEDGTVFTDAFRDLDELITAGRVTFDQSALDLCVQAYQTADCVLGIPGNSACDRVFDGTQQANDPCFFGNECASGLFCSRGAGLGNCGTCAAEPVAGQSCDIYTPCDATSDCFNLGQQGTDDFRCVPINAQEGMPCGTAATGLCEGSLACTGSGQTFMCTQPGRQGATCAPQQFEMNPPCLLAEGWFCDNGTCGAADWADNGAGCGGTTLCREGICDQATSVCSELPGIGQSCMNVGACNDDAFCDGANCRPLVADGQACNASAECLGESVCLGAGVGRPGTCGALTWQMCQ